MAVLYQSNNSSRAGGRTRRPAPKSAPGTGPSGAAKRPDGTGTLRRVFGLLLMHLGFGGALLSMLWDVFYRGRTFDIDAVGPFKLSGVAAGIALAVTGLVVAFFPGKKVHAVADGPKRPPADRSRPPPAGWDRKIAPVAPRPDGPRPGLALRKPAPEERIPEALPVVDGIPVAPGSDVPEAVPLEAAPQAPAQRPWDPN